MNKILRPLVFLLQAGVLLSMLSRPAKAELSEDVEPSMVRIFTFVPAADGRNINTEVNAFSMGTGFVISNEGHILTNQHVIEELSVGDTELPPGAVYLVVSKQEKVYKCFRARLLWSSVNKDLALIQCTDLKVKPLILSFLDMPKGTDCYSMGYPGIGDQVTAGDAFFSELVTLTRQNSTADQWDITNIVNAEATRANRFDATMTKGSIERNTPAPGFDESAGNPHISVWYHSLDIRKGNSGGPFFNSCGQVMGVVGRSRYKANDQSQAVVFAMRVTEAKAELERFGVKFTAATELCKPGSLLQNNNKLIFAIALSATVAMAALLMAVFKSPKGRAVVTSYTTIVEDKVRSILRRQQGGGGPGVGNTYNRGGMDYNRGGGPPPVFPPPMPPPGYDQTVPRPPAMPDGGGSGYWTLTGRASDGRNIRLDLPGSLFSRNGNRVVLGRSADLCHLAVTDTSVSKQHAQIRMSGGRFFVADRNSANGTLVNGHLCKESFKETAFREGDTLTLGEVRLVFQRG